MRSLASAVQQVQSCKRIQPNPAQRWNNWRSHRRKESIPFSAYCQYSTGTQRKTHEAAASPQRRGIELRGDQ